MRFRLSLLRAASVLSPHGRNFSAIALLIIAGLAAGIAPTATYGAGASGNPAPSTALGSSGVAGSPGVAGAPTATASPGATGTAAAPASPSTSAAASALASGLGPPATSKSSNCLVSGDGYFRARLGGAIDAKIDWPNSGTRCEGEPRDKPAGVRLSFQRASGGSKDYLFVFGLTGVREGQPARAVGANLTLIVQGTSRIYGTLGDSRCTVDSLTQSPLQPKHAYRVEARGFCTQPAHAVRGKDAVLVSTFEFAGLVIYDPPKDEAAPAMSTASVK